MARLRGSIPIHSTLRNAFPDAWIRREARACGVVRRQRKLDSVTLFWALVLGFADGRARSLAGLRRAFNRVGDQTLSPSSFYQRFTPALRDLMRRALERAFEPQADESRRLEGILARFRDVILVDTTLIRLHEALAELYPGLRNAKAALKVHTVFSVRGAGRRSVQLTSERGNEVRTLVIGPWVSKRLLLVDLGYFAYELFARIEDEGGLFLSRLKRHVNLPILDEAGRPVGRLRDALAAADQDRVDVVVEMPTLRTPSGRWSARGGRAMRVVGHRAPGQTDWHLYLTNVPCDRLTADEIGQVYAARWEIELIFKEAKSYYGMADLPSRKPEIVETLLYASLLTLVMSRRLVALVQQRIEVHGDRVRPQRWAGCVRAVADQILRIVVGTERRVRIDEQRLTRMLLREAVDPNRRRRSLIHAVDRGTHRYMRNAVATRTLKQIAC